jgi:hypothetical protein
MVMIVPVQLDLFLACVEIDAEDSCLADELFEFLLSHV